jgi:hypothetical protein
VLTGGYIKLHRKIVDWEWYHDPVVSRVFLHLLVTANYEPCRFEGQEIGVGQCVISLKNVAEKLGVSKDAVNRALKKLEKSGELQRLPTAKFTIVTLKNYPYYQQSATLPDRLPYACLTLADPMEEGKKGRNKEIKKEEGGAPVHDAPLTPAPEITFDFIISVVGKKLTDEYIERVRAWLKKKNIPGEVKAETVFKWLKKDGKWMPVCEAGSDKSSFSVDELEAHSFDRYRK